MKAAIGCLIGLVFVVSVSAEPLFEGQVRLESGEPVADAQVRIFDMTDLRQGAIARALTDGTGYFALPLAALGGRALPARFALGPNYPNPFNPSTIIPYQLAASSQVRLEVFNLLGQRITTLVDGERPAGFHKATWHATDGAGRAVGAGVYIYRMMVGVESQTGRMVLLDGQAGVSAGGVASVMPGVSGVGGSNEADAQVYGLIVSGSGLVPYVDSSFRVEAGMAPVELVVSSGQYSAGKATDDDCAFCDLFGTFNDQQEDETEEEEAETDSTSSEGGPDLIVQSPSVSAVMLMPGQAFTLHVTVHNQGDEQAAATTLHYYRSNNATITSSDTEVGTDEIGVLDASATSAASIALTAPTSVSAEVGIYYGACVASVRGESNTDNNCSSAVKITVSGQESPEEEGDETPAEEEDEAVDDASEDTGTGSGSGTGGRDWWLVIQSLEVSDNSLTAGQSFTLETMVYNQAAHPVSQWLFYFRSTDATIDLTDVLIHADGGWAVTDLKPSATQTVSLDWTAPPYAGTYYYGVCTGDGFLLNCSTGARVTVEGSKGGSPDLIAHSSLVSHNTVTPGSRFTLRVKVENIGTGPAAATAMHYYRSDDETIDATDTELTNPYPAGTTGRLAVLGTWDYGLTWPVPFEAGTHYYGICVDPTVGETNIDNNCSIGIPIIVEGSEGGSPDLIVVAPSILDYRPKTGEFRLWAAVRNIGSSSSASTTVLYYRSNDATIDATDTQVRLQYIPALAVEGLADWPPVYHPNDFSNSVTAPTSTGTYYYGACVDPVPGESDTNNNCSEAVPMNVGVPDLTVGLAWVSTSTPLAGESFTLTATVRNQGPDQAASTTVHYYRSDDATIDATDTPIGTNAVSRLTGFDGLVSGPGSRLAASGTSRESISVSAPSSPGTYYYGACVDPVSREANTDNNCSTGVYVRVVPSGDDPFNIELVFVSDFTDARKDVMQQAARRWETIITKGLPDVNFSTNPHSLSFGDGTIVVDDTVDDLRIFVYKDATVTVGVGGLSYVRSGNPTGLPAIGRVWIGAPFLTRRQREEPLWQEERLLRDLMLHEIAHVLGYGSLWRESGLVHELSGDTYFSGELAIQAFNAAGGENYSGNKVPVVFGDLGGCSAGSHWRDDVFRGLDRQFGAEVMEPVMEREHALSAITIQSLADLGYVVDVSRADPYKLPASISTSTPRTSSAKPVVSHGFDLGALGTIYVGDEQGRISHTISSH